MMFLPIVIAIVAIPLLILFYRYALKGKIGNFSGGGVGNALFQVHTFLSPSAQNIVEAKKQREQDAKQGDAGDDEPPDLPPWAQPGD
jgi:hypothetical protein